MNNRLALFKEVFKSLSRTQRASSRKLYTDSIYPYPFNYFNNKVYPSQVQYRETWKLAPWTARTDVLVINMMRAFWTWWWYCLFSDPGVILGHYHYPDPSKWTDAELGIPPDEVGPYAEWYERKIAEA